MDDARWASGGVRGNAEGQVGEAERVPVAVQPAGSVVVGPLSDLDVVVGEQPLLEVGEVAGLEGEELVLTRLLDPQRPVALRHGDVGEARDRRQLDHVLPHPLRLHRTPDLPRALAEDEPPARLHEPAQSLECHLRVLAEGV